MKTVEKVAGKKVRFELAPRRPGDPAVLVASSELIKNELGWEPKYASLDTIVSTAWKWHMDHPSGYKK